MATNRTPVVSKPASKKKATSATAKPPATSMAAPKPRASTATTKAAKPKQAKLAVDAAETSLRRATKKAATKKALAPEERYLMIERAAYFLAERHGFSSGRALDDWIAAEKEVDSMIKSAG